MTRLRHVGIGGVLVWIFLSSASSGAPVQVVATTTVVADVVSSIGGDAIELNVLLPAGADPHSFEPTPQDLVLVAGADLIFLAGAGLEESLLPFLSDVSERTVLLSDEIDLPLRTALASDEDHNAHEDGPFDPHVWFDPAYVAAWADVVAARLAARIPESEEVLAGRLAAYRDELQALDEWILAETARVPAADRILVTDHAVLGYFAARYGWVQQGTILPGFSTLAEPSARERAALVDTVLAMEIPVLFVGTTIRPDLADQLSVDTSTRIVLLYTGALSGPDGPAPDYLEMMRFNVRAMVEGLAQSP